MKLFFPFILILCPSLPYIFSIPASTTVSQKQCTHVDTHHIHCTVPGNSLRFFVIGDIGGEEIENTVDGTVSYRPTVGQHAVAIAMDVLAKRQGAPNFVLNLGDNFYERGVTHEDIQERFKQNFMDVYNYDTLQVPWYTIAGNNDWDSKDGIAPQMKQLNRQWIFPAEHYTVQYTLGNGVTVRLIMIDTTLMCGKGASHFGKLKSKNEEKYREKIKVAMQHLKWLWNELREARKIGVDFLFVAGHHGLHINNHPRNYPCAPRVHALLAHYGAHAYFAGHEHNLKYFEHEDGVKYILSGAGCHLENAINRDRFPPQFLKYMKFGYPEKVPNTELPEGLKSSARGVIDGGGFVGVEIDGRERMGRIKFYGAGQIYDKNGQKHWEELHEFEGVQIEIAPKNPRDICAEFLAFDTALVETEHFVKDSVEKIQSVLGKYLCAKIGSPTNGNEKKNENGKLYWTDEIKDQNLEGIKDPNLEGIKDPNLEGIKDQNLGEIKDQKLEEIKDQNLEEIKDKQEEKPEIGVFAEELFDTLRTKLGIGIDQLVNSFLSDDLVELGALGKSRSVFYRTRDQKFMLKSIVHDYELATMEEMAENYAKHLMALENDTFLTKFFMIFRLKIEEEMQTMMLMNNFFYPARDLENVVKFDVKGTFSFQRPPYPKFENVPNLSEKLLKWYHFFGWEPYGVEPMFQEGILLDKIDHRQILERLRKDFECLAENNVNDWSIAYAIHFEKPDAVENALEENNVPYIRGHCEKCRAHPSQLEPFEASRPVRIYMGIVDFLMPFSEKRKAKYVKDMQRHLGDKGADLLNYIKGNTWENFGPIPPPLYGDRMMAFFMGCALRWQHAPVTRAEAARRALIAAYCDAYAEARTKDVSRTYQVGQYTITVHHTQLYKDMMELRREHAWTLINELAADHLIETDQNKFETGNGLGQFVCSVVTDERKVMPADYHYALFEIQDSKKSDEKNDAKKGPQLYVVTRR